MTTTIDTLSRIAIQNAQLLAPLVGLVLFLVAQRYLGRWPDLWRPRRLVLPVLDRLTDGDYDDELDVLNERVGIDLAAAADTPALFASNERFNGSSRAQRLIEETG
jgi:hypothetical protein